jgi:hypothetical protein
MSTTVFLAVCVLGLDFMIYVLFQWTYGDKRSAIARQVAVQRNALKEQVRRTQVPTRGPLRAAVQPADASPKTRRAASSQGATTTNNNSPAKALFRIGGMSFQDSRHHAEAYEHLLGHRRNCVVGRDLSHIPLDGKPRHRPSSYRDPLFL